MRDTRTTVAALVVLGALLIAPGAPAAPPLDLAGADALAASHGGSSGDLLGKWAAKASLAEILYVLRRPASELRESEAPLVEEALKKTPGDRHALRARLVARLAMVAPGRFKKQLDLLAEGGGAPPRVRASVFRVAALLPGEGSYETYGHAVRLGLQFGLAEGRGAGEPPIELSFWPTGDDDPGRTAAALDSALESSAVVVGGLLSVPTMSIATGARIARAVVVSPTATDESVGEVGPGVFQIGPSAARRAAALARACREGTPRGVGVLHSTETGHRGLGEQFAVAAESLGLQVVWRDTYAPGAEDFHAAIRAMTSQKVDMLFWDGDSREADALLRQLAQEKVAIRLCGGDELAPDQYHAETRAMLEGARHVAEDWLVGTRTMAKLDSVARAAGEEKATPLYVRGYLAGRFIAAAVRQGALCAEELTAALGARVERQGDPDLRFLDCASEGATLPVYAVTRGRSVAGSP
jgi:ABC-type branched-subunit amino acid transport system substrate-binding protein